VSYAEQWDAIAGRIRGLRTAGELYMRSLQGGHMDGGRELVTQCKNVIEELKVFQGACKAVLPGSAVRCLEDFLDGDAVKKIAAEVKDPRAPLVFLATFETHMSYLLANRQERIRVRAERAFVHLHWSLAVDEQFRARWDKAFDGGGEVSCEALGGVHLLWHGIFAFKIDTPPARTDLVLNKGIDELDERAVEGFVLTEWKKGSEAEAARLFVEADVQLREYEQGPLGGTELAGYRYAIFVSKEQLPHDLVPKDEVVRDAVLRHINIAIHPRPPAKEGRAQRAAADRAKKKRLVAAVAGREAVPMLCCDNWGKYYLATVP
jgi:hypothetical protein